MTYVDIGAEDVDDVDEVIVANTNVVPVSSYSHPDRTGFHRMEFGLRVNAMIVKTALDKAGIDNSVK